MLKKPESLVYDSLTGLCSSMLEHARQRVAIPVTTLRCSPRVIKANFWPLYVVAVLRLG